MLPSMDIMRNGMNGLKHIVIWKRYHRHRKTDRILDKNDFSRFTQEIVCREFKQFWSIINMIDEEKSLYLIIAKNVKISLAPYLLLWYNNTAVCGSISSEDENKNLYTTFL